jgi:hypothetical protein
MWPDVYIEQRSKTWRDRDRKWSQSEVGAGHRSSQASIGRSASVLPLKPGVRNAARVAAPASCRLRDAQRDRAAHLVNLSGQLCSPTVETCRLRFGVQRALEERRILGRELPELILQLSDHAPVFQSAIGVTFQSGVGSMTCGGPVQLVKDCTVVCVDGIAANARLTGERSHSRAAGAIVQKASKRLAQALRGAGASPCLRGGIRLHLDLWQCRG